MLAASGAVSSGPRTVQPARSKNFLEANSALRSDGSLAAARMMISRVFTVPKLCARACSRSGVNACSGSLHRRSPTEIFLFSSAGSATGLDTNQCGHRGFERGDASFERLGMAAFLRRSGARGKPFLLRAAGSGSVSITTTSRHFSDTAPTAARRRRSLDPSPARRAHHLIATGGI